MKKILVLILTLVVLTSLAACGSSSTPAATAAPAAAEDSAPAEAPAAAEAVKLVVGASSTPHGELLEIVKPVLAEQGIDLEIVIYDDYSVFHCLHI